MNIKQMRRMVGITQLELAHLAGIDRTRVSFAECGYVSLSAEEKSAIRRSVAKVAEKKVAAAKKSAERALRLMAVRDNATAIPTS